jgi:hypothetical protein
METIKYRGFYITIVPNHDEGEYYLYVTPDGRPGMEPDDWGPWEERDRGVDKMKKRIDRDMSMMGLNENPIKHDLVVVAVGVGLLGGIAYVLSRL